MNCERCRNAGNFVRHRTGATIGFEYNGSWISGPLRIQGRTYSEWIVGPIGIGCARAIRDSGPPSEGIAGAGETI